MNSEISKQRLIRRSEVLSRVGLSRSSIYRRMTDGEFPRPIDIGGGRVAWLESDIDGWINQRLAEAGRAA
ncbi:helix-turn-helix transcriptional regulator [Rheinheimera maricola]|uniref:AlpA family transcriptional regulator n=1 Tax=Rheinheimera maricola TaxID=2793282 RepID=A0ABS7XCS2_9GAMM|nr:AlpA family transcriptional regulator [Rheinheimera maricola]MBZ9612567.1 AlpA family transcriptional regulator [Rheinheimera maricola]